ncbi:MAG TPA: endo alpha-1,4 polygalactosaminidase [Burkholderiales bacterium]|nr:endo alpha-1,4 polygalactosaminidase [Burkholderiales bacterium]
MLRKSVGLLLLLSACAYAASPNVAFFYGPNPPWDELRAFDVVVVEPEYAPDPRAYSAGNTQVFAYVSMGEVERTRPYAKDLPPEWIPGANEPWNSVVIDQTQARWPRFLIDRIIAPLWKAGYRGFFLDTLDSFQLISKTDEDRAKQAAALADTVRAIRKAFPEAKLIFNRGFEILPQLHGEAYAVAVESIYRGWNAKDSKYVEVPQQDRDWILAQMKRVRDEYGLPAIAIEYVPPGERDLARETARRVAGLGFTPWVTTSDLGSLGVGAIEVMPRKILMLYDSRGNELNLYAERVHAFATLPLNYLGYAVDYADINAPLPAGTLVGRYAGIVTWFGAEPQANKQALNEWLARQRRDGMRIAMLGTLPFAPASDLAREFGIAVSAPRAPVQRLTAVVRDQLIGYEDQPAPDARFFVPLAAKDATVLLRLRSNGGDSMDAAAMMPWGGYALAPYEVASVPGATGYYRWIIQPFEFLRRALALPDMPVPDVTTENGRRLMIVHVNGDGFAAAAEGGRTAGEALGEILQKYRVPTTVGVAAGETASNGRNPQLSPMLEATARRIFAIPHVEIAAMHEPQYDLGASIAYVNSLAPPAKRARMVLWGGDANPPAATVARAFQENVLNMNGGGAATTKQGRSYTLVWPMGLRKGSGFQVHAPVSGDATFTANFSQPAGFERAIETFELTEIPYRIKPIDIQYQPLSAARSDALAALTKVYDWALAQPVMNVYASEYAQKVLDFNRMVVARSADGWMIRGGGTLRELRMPSSLGVPDVSASRAIAGFQRRANDIYVHTAAPDALLRLAPDAPSQPYLVEANGRVERWQHDGSTLRFGLQGYVPLRFSLANVSGCQVDGDAGPLAGVAQGGMTRYELKQNGIERISVSCAS